MHANSVLTRKYGDEGSESRKYGGTALSPLEIDFEPELHGDFVPEELLQSRNFTPAGEILFAA